MPRQNGAGPRGAGRMSGRGMGPCSSGGRRGRSGGVRGMGRGNVCRQNVGGGFGRGIWLEEDSPEKQKELLLDRKEFLEERINCINAQLEEL